MARVTVEDCIEKVSNRFNLVLMAAQRSREISSGSSLTVERDNDKNPVIALREIAEGTVSPVKLEEGLVKSLQRHAEVEVAPLEYESLDQEALERFGSLEARRKNAKKGNKMTELDLEDDTFSNYEMSAEELRDLEEELGIRETEEEAEANLETIEGDFSTFENMELDREEE